MVSLDHSSSPFEPNFEAWMSVCIPAKANWKEESIRGLVERAAEVDVERRGQKCCKNGAF